MKRLICIIAAACICLSICGCQTQKLDSHLIAATTLPVYDFTNRLCQGTDIQVVRLITESVSCLHDYTLKVDQMRAINAAEMVVISGVGLEDFLDDTLIDANSVLDASAGIPLLCAEKEHNHGNDSHHHAQDPHIWLAPENAKMMCKNISNGLIKVYPENKNIILANLQELCIDIDALTNYANVQLANISSRDIITFHDGFSYMADAYDLNILHAIEEESGSEASALELTQLVSIVNEHHVKAIFVEGNGSSSAAYIVSTETGVSVYTLDMAMSGKSYFDAMYHNIDTLKEALE